MRKIHYILIALMVVAINQSCSDDFLDKYPSDKLSTASFWSNEADANAGLVAIYDALAPIKHTNPERGAPTLGTMGLFDLITPIGNDRTARMRAIAEGIHSGSTNSVVQPWRHAFRAIARANDFLDNIDKITFESKDAEKTKARMKGEAYFLRALNYYFLVELYGDVPLFRHVPTVEDAFTERAPKSEVLGLIKEDLAFAVDNLLLRADSEVGRATKGSAKALQVKVALYEKDWNTAATISEEIMGMGYSLVPNYGDIFTIANENNEEVLFSVQYVFMNDAERGSQMEKLYANRSAASSGWSWMQPTLWYVEQCEKIINNPVEGVDFENEDSTRISNELYAFYEGRDPRMDHTILRPGSHFVDSKDTDVLYPHGISGPQHSQTGMHMRKYVVPGSSDALPWDSPLDFILFRYADILLCHVEAVAMRDGVGSVTQDVLDKTINLVRARSSNLLPPYTAGNITMDDIYRERIVELAFEGWTYFDMKRSGMIEMNNGYEVKGLTVQAGDTVFFNSDPINGKRIFDPATHYVFPIPSAEIEKSSGALKQNPNYPQ